ncbi:hypothetical protein DYB32_009025 [Aphanomyces invadans]|uniref:Uncharacterized protein n=1 Tax=Aphanomyces invadans TaxID=157072 RepID=A0A3R6YZP8_9STRA|nr:hypothetical protein DYB32_009025 [Aphanomyces invadans]
MMTVPDDGSIPSRVLREAVLRKLEGRVSALVHGKNYLVDKKAFMAHLSQDSLTRTFLQAGVVAIANPYASPKTVSSVLSAWSLSFWRAISYTTVTRVLEDISVHYLRALMKDVAKSSLRKYARYQRDKTIAASLIFHTTFRAAILPNMSVLLVEAVVDMYRLPTHRWSAFLQRSVGRFLAALAYTSIGAALATLIAPGEWTRIGANLGEAFAYGHLGMQTLMCKDIAPVAGFFWRVTNYHTMYFEV